MYNLVSLHSNGADDSLIALRSLSGNTAVQSVMARSNSTYLISFLTEITYKAYG
jgi:hypothetical protein